MFSRTLLLALMLPFFIFQTVQAASFKDGAEKDEAVPMQDEDPAMQRAFKLARSSLDGFLVKASNPPAGTQSYAVKIGLTEANVTEYFWLGELSLGGTKLTGRITNEPSAIKTVKLGQVYTFSKDQVVDWTYIDLAARKMVGNFTACALLSKESPEEAELMKKQYGLACE